MSQEYKLVDSHIIDVDYGGGYDGGLEMPQIPDSFRGDSDSESQGFVSSASVSDDDTLSLLHDSMSSDHRYQPSGYHTFYKNFYKYYLDGGFRCAAMSTLLKIFILAFTIIFSTFLFIFVDWHSLFQCSRQNESKDPGVCNGHIIRHNIASYINWFHITYFVILSIYWIWCTMSLVMELKNSWNTGKYVTEVLKLTDDKLQMMSWDDLLKKQLRIQNANASEPSFDEHKVALMIMSTENYVIGMYNKKVIDTRIPFIGRCSKSQNFLTKNLEWNFNFCVTGFMYSKDTHLIDQDFINHPHLLSRRIIVIGFVNLLLTPIILTFMCLTFFFKHAEEFYKNPTQLANRTWTTYARWNFREFNELSHVFERRMNASIKPANEFVKTFPSQLASIISKFITFVFGSFVSVMIVFVLVDDSLLFKIEFLEKNLLWYLGVFLSIIAFSRPFIIQTREHYDCKEYLVNIAAHTHYLPKRWKSKANTPQIKEEFLGLFKYKIVVFLMEIFSVIVTPWIMWFSLARSADDIVKFVSQNTIRLDDVGDVCVLATFDFENHGNYKYGSVPEPSAENEGSTRMSRTRQGKMEKSFVNFKEQHPNWTSQYSRKGDMLMNNVNTSNASLASLPTNASVASLRDSNESMSQSTALLAMTLSKYGGDFK
uniref:Autophagy-related protein 9 n=1 Tax=viral metagenome TaxID=1070528 RepID=A0A6C0CJJ1_9ZZZZ